MGEVQRTGSDVEADAFFAQFVDAAPEVIQRVAGERGANLAAVVAEDKAFGYWDRKMAARAARRVERDRLEVQERARRLQGFPLAASRVEGARLAPLPVKSVVLLPVPRFVILTDAEYNDTARWWSRLDNPTTARSLARRIQNEISDAARAERRRVRAVAAWQEGERAFERAQWKAVIANRDSRPQRKAANQWVAIGEDRAMEIALAVLGKAVPPQGRK